jgi:hypothetical protein
MDNSRGKLDRLIDSALSGYSDTQPLAGMEDRVLNRVRLAERGHRRRLGWGIALALAASLAIVAILIQPGPQHAPKSARRGPAPDRGLIAPPGERRAATRHTARKPSAHTARPRGLPKREQFPSPAPMNAEERALLALVRRNPEEARQMLAALQKRTTEPIAIQPVEVAPLNDEGAQ